LARSPSPGCSSPGCRCSAGSCERAGITRRTPHVTANIDTAAAYGNEQAIGVCNFHSDRLVDLIDHDDVPPAVNQIETHPFFQRQADQDLMRERGVQIESWGPFAEGRNNLFSDPLLSEIGGVHGRSVAQVVLRWLIQRDVVVIPKSVRRERMAENFDVFDFELTDDEMTRIAGMDTGASLFFDHRDPAMVSRLGNVRVD
jgi:2,5-diketo-D-gluconate reductase A